MLARIARFPRVAATVAVAVILAGGALARTVTAFNPQPDPPFAMVGIAQGQTARLNLVNTSPTDSLIPPGPCRARLRFLDADGNVIAHHAVEVEAGHSTFLDFSPSTIPVDTLGDVVGPFRAEIRATVTFLDDQIPPGPCRVNVEIFDTATGRTTVLIPPGPCRGTACVAGQ